MADDSVGGPWEAWTEADFAGRDPLESSPDIHSGEKGDVISCRTTKLPDRVPEVAETLC